MSPWRFYAWAKTLAADLKEANSPRVSRAWLDDCDRLSNRVEHHSANWEFPIRQMLNDSAVLQTQRLRRRA